MVQRHAKITESIFSYYDDKSKSSHFVKQTVSFTAHNFSNLNERACFNSLLDDVQPKFLTDLRYCKVTQVKDKNEFYIEHPTDKKPLKLALSSLEEHKRWQKVFVESMMSDQVLRRHQVLEPLERQK